MTGKNSLSGTRIYIVDKIVTDRYIFVKLILNNFFII